MMEMETWEPVSPSQSTNMPDKLKADQMDGGTLDLVRVAHPSGRRLREDPGHTGRTMSPNWPGSRRRAVQSGQGEGNLDRSA